MTTPMPLRMPINGERRTTTMPMNDERVNDDEPRTCRNALQGCRRLMQTRRQTPKHRKSAGQQVARQPETLERAERR